MKTLTHPVFPPIPIRGLDWCATFDNYEPGQPIGHGDTEKQAIADLLSKRDTIDAQSVASNLNRTETQYDRIR
jgi:hypothetical protein